MTQASMSSNAELVVLCGIARDGTLTPEQFAQLESLLAESAEARQFYVQFFQLDAWLSKHSSEGVQASCESEAAELAALVGVSRDSAAARPSWIHRKSTRWLAIAAALLLAAWPVYRSLNGPPSVVDRPFPHIATVAASIDALWSGQLVPDSEGWLPAESVHLRRGQAEIHFVSGAVVMLKAPATFQAISPTEAKLTQGSIAARVDGSKTNFRIFTPTADVIDLGTEFGLAVTDSGETDVAVFNGMVDVSPFSSRAAAPSLGDKSQRRLAAGEALRVDWQGQFRRIATITDETFPPMSSPQQRFTDGPPLIEAVTDTLRDGDENPKFYRIVSHGFGEDCQAYVDRNFEWNGVDSGGLPDFLLGADYIMSFNDDKAKDLEVSIVLSRPATVYVLFDDRERPRDWLTGSFVDTGFDVGMDEDAGLPVNERFHQKLGSGPGVSVDYVFSVWKSNAQHSGTVVLGPLGPQPGSRSMYGIVVVPLESQ